MTPRQSDIVEQGYRMFRGFELNGRLTVCNCPSCVTPEVQAQLIATPARRISRALLAEYTDSAHGRSPDHELKHFLPRYVELILAGEMPSNIDAPLALNRLRDSDWRTDWSAAEQDYLDEALREILRAALTAGEPLAAFRIDDIVAMLARAQADMPGLLALWDGIETPFASRRVAELVEARGPMSRKGEYRIERLSKDAPEAEAAIFAWLARPETKRRLEEAFFAAPDAAAQEQLSFAIQLL